MQETSRAVEWPVTKLAVLRPVRGLGHDYFPKWSRSAQGWGPCATFNRGYRTQRYNAKKSAFSKAPTVAMNNSIPHFTRDVSS